MRTQGVPLPRRPLWVVPIVAALVFGPLPARAAATVTVCTLDPGYAACGRAFPDPQAGLGLDPNQEGRIPATDFIQYGLPGTQGLSQIWDGLKLLEQKYGRWLEVYRLDELLDDPDAMSAGLWVAGQRQRLPLIMARVTDETVPVKDKRKFAFGLSLHGIERAGVEGGTRALEDLVTYSYCESLGNLAAARADSICALQNHVIKGEFVEGEGGFPAHLLPWDAQSMTMGESLKRTELYFTYNNPDGWHRGDLPAFGGIAHYQRYNGNGIDPNRDWPTQGYTFTPYTPNSEPETRAFHQALKQREGGEWGGGIDLHGQGCAPVLTYTMLPAGQNDYAKNRRIREIAERTQFDGHERLGWSAFIEDDSGQPNLPPPFLPGLCGVSLQPMGPQQWGTVWDTINYTITGSLGDWINNPTIGLGGVGMDNEMSLSHVTNCGIGSCFLPDIEQLHVAGNKGLIYADIDTTVRTESIDYEFPWDGKGAYLDHAKVRRSAAALRGTRVLDLPPQVDTEGQIACAGATLGGALAEPTRCKSEEFEIQGPADGVFNGGVTLDLGYIATHSTNDTLNATYVLERFTSDHEDEGEWVEVARHYNEQQLYASNGMTITLNDPVPGRYRLRISAVLPGVYTYEIRFSTADAHDDPGQRAYRATNLDFFDELNRYLPANRQFAGLTAEQIASDVSLLDQIDSLVLADVALPGWNFEKPAKSTLPKRTHDAYFAALRDWVRRGGNLVLTDGAVQGLADLLRQKKLAATLTGAFAGYVGFNDGSGTTYDDPLAAKINVPGAAEGDGNRHQTYEPVPLGYDLRDGDTSQRNSPIWTIDPESFGKAGGRIAGMANEGVNLGEIKLGRGSIRIAGALLPMPTEEFDHPYGLASYALTWTGWQLFENLLQTSGSVVPSVQVLGRSDELPQTGITPGWIIFALALAGAAIVIRRMRHTSLL